MKIIKYKYQDDLIFKDNGQLVEDKRFDGNKIIDIKNYDIFYIDKKGIKHIKDFGGYQKLKCKYNDELINDNGVWRVKDINDYKKEIKNKIWDMYKTFIFSKYPLETQQQDIADKEIVINKLINMNSNYTVDYLYKKVMSYITDIMQGNKTIDDIIATFPIEEQDYWRKLINIGLKLGYVDINKNEVLSKLKELDSLNNINDIIALPSMVEFKWLK